MVGVYYDLLFKEEGSSCHGGLSFTTYAPTREEAEAWGTKQAWDFIHQERPARRVLEKLKSAPVANYLLTDTGIQPLHFEEVRKINANRRFEEERAFGIGSSGYIDFSEQPQPSVLTPPELTDIQKLRSDLELHYAPGTKEHAVIVQNANWDPTKQALYLFTVTGESREEWREVVFCRAINFHHAPVIWSWHCMKERGQMQPAGFGLAHSFCACDEPLFSNRRKQR